MTEVNVGNNSVIYISGLSIVILALVCYLIIRNNARKP